MHNHWDKKGKSTKLLQDDVNCKQPSSAHTHTHTHTHARTHTALRSIMVHWKGFMYYDLMHHTWRGSPLLILFPLSFTFLSIPRSFLSHVIISPPLLSPAFPPLLCTLFYFSSIFLSFPIFIFPFFYSYFFHVLLVLLFCVFLPFPLHPSQCWPWVIWCSRQNLSWRPLASQSISQSIFIHTACVYSRFHFF